MRGSGEGARGGFSHSRCTHYRVADAPISAGSNLMCCCGQQLSGCRSGQHKQ